MTDTLATALEDALQAWERACDTSDARFNEWLWRRTETARIAWVDASERVSETCRDLRRMELAAAAQEGVIA